MEKNQMLTDWEEHKKSLEKTPANEDVAKESWETGEDFLFAYVMTLIM